jgi:hypothetical protein
MKHAHGQTRYSVDMIHKIFLSLRNNLNSVDIYRKPKITGCDDVEWVQLAQDRDE